jgi:putative ABC transport system permease protein
MGTFLQDLKYGTRMLAKNLGFTLTAVLTLALGIGANTAIFSVVNAEFLEPLPYQDSGKLMKVWTTFTHGVRTTFSTSYPDFADWRAQNRVFEKIAAYTTRDSASLTGVETPEHLNAIETSWDLFELLGSTPEIGRTFVAEEDGPNRRAVVLSDHIWRQIFGANPRILGQTITLDGTAYTVVGVMPANFQFPPQSEPADVYRTFSHMQVGTEGSPAITSQRGAHFLSVIARLKPGVTLAQAGADMDLVASRLEKQYPDSNKYSGARVVPFQKDMTGSIRPALWVLSIAVGLVLLIACVNVANLLLARATTRGREIAIRTALGAERGRLVRQLLTESMLLSLLAGAAGVVFAAWSTALLVRMSAEKLPRVSAIHVDGWVIGFAVAISLVTGVIFGLAPALEISGASVVEALKEGAATMTAGGGRLHLRRSLVVVEMALALVLVVSASLLIRSLERLSSVKPGFDPRGVMTSNVDLPDRYTNEKQVEFYQALMARLNALPGVQSAAGVAPLPLSGEEMEITFEIEGRPVAKSDEPSASFRVTTPRYFKTMRIPQWQGRDFTDDDNLTSQPVAIVNKAFAERYFYGENPIGQHIRPGISVDNRGARMREIVGVVGNVKFLDLKMGWDPEIYVPATQIPLGSLTIVARAQGDPRSLAMPIALTVRGLDPDLPAYRPETVGQLLDGTLAVPRFNTALLSAFAGLALLLTSVGLFGVISYSVAQRRHEIGIRMALGAQAKDMLALVIGDGLKLTAIGVGLGVVAALASTQLLASLLFGVTARDPLTFALVIALLFGVTLLACYLPARRALQVDPMVALRYQ